jgi:ABC-type Fe3+/spermidine/putrescine transport system ATPase subunit
LAAIVLKLQHISKRFGPASVLQDLSLDIEEGEIFSLLGPSGCGKTTTLRIVAGLERPEQGTILLRGSPIVSVAQGMFVPTHKRDMGMVFQNYAIWPHKTVFENVAYPLRVRHIGQADVRRRVTRMLEIVGLSGLEQRPAPQLSGGQQQRVALARALVYEPSLLLLDEPFSNLDAQLREQMRVQLRFMLRQVGVTAVFVTHDQSEALSLSDRIALMNKGAIEQVGKPRDLYERPASAFVRDFLGRTMLLEATIEGQTENGTVRIRVPELPDSMLEADTHGARGAAPGASVLVAIRPEDIQIVPVDHAQHVPNQMTVTVETALFMGDHLECRVKLGPREALWLHAPRSSAITEGSALRLTVAPECLAVWPR